MASTHLSNQDLQSFRQGTMAATALLEADQHLAVCAECAQRLAGGLRLPQLANTLARLQTELAEAESEACDYFSFEQKAAYVNGELSAADRSFANLHLEICPECHLEIEELRALRASLPLQREYAPPAVPTLWEKLRALWELPAFRLSLQGLGLAAAMVLIIWMMNSVWRVSVIGPAGERMEPHGQSENVLTKRETEAQPKQSTAQTDLPAVTAVQPPQTALALQDGQRQITLDEGGNLSGLDTLSPASQAAIKVALKTQRVKISPLLGEMRGPSLQLLGGQPAADQFALLSPVGKVAQTTRPSFRWQPLAGASNYYVTIYDANQQKIAASPALTTPEWTPEQELARGQLYYWQVRAVREGQEYFAPAPSSPDAKFRILGQAQAVELERVKNSQPSHLALGVLYAQAGLLEEARQEFEALAAANPRSQVAQKLLQSVKR
jgi:anti-sigma factor RsiW